MDFDEALSAACELWADDPRVVVVEEWFGRTIGSGEPRRWIKVTLFDLVPTSHEPSCTGCEGGTKRFLALEQFMRSIPPGMLEHVAIDLVRSIND